MYLCRWMNGDVSFVFARTREDATVLLDEWDDAEGAEISKVRDFIVDFRLNDERGSELREFRESCRIHSPEGTSSSAQSDDCRSITPAAGLQKVPR